MRLPARPVLAAGLVLATILAAAGYFAYLRSTREVPAPGGRLVEGLVSDGHLSLLPPFATESDNSRDLSALLYRGLTRSGPDGSPLPELASSWQLDSQTNTRVFTFTLRPGLKWSDGAPLTSKDAVFTLAVLQSEFVRETPLGQAWQGIKVTAPDARTVRYELPSPSAPFLSLTNIGLLPDHALGSQPMGTLRDITSAPVSGPFSISAFEFDRVTMTRNPHAFERPYLDSLEFRLFATEQSAVDALIAGQLDTFAGFTAASAQRVLKSPSRRVLSAHSFAYTELLYNQKQGALTDRLLRRAIGQAVDRQALVRGPLGGYGQTLNSPIPPAITWLGPQQVAKADPVAARKTLETDGWRLPAGGKVRQKDGKDLEVGLAAADLEPYRMVATSISANLAAVGIRVKLNILPEADLIGTVLQPRNFEMVLTAVDNGPDPDIYVFWHSKEATAGGFNFSGMPADAFLDNDLEIGRFNVDRALRKKAYLEVTKILADNQPADFLFSPDLLFGFSARVKGVDLGPAVASGQRFQAVQDWYVQTRRVRR